MPVALTRVSALIVALVVSSSVVDASAQSRGSTPVKVTLGTPSEYSITPSRTTVKAGKTTFVVANSGAVTHELNIIRVPSAKTTLPKGTSAAQVREKGKIAAVEGLKAGTRRTISVTLTRGTYQLFCNIPGHYAAGMRASITVQ
jgi:uncharacterized cupredoxin-like copper-binding protein